MYGFRAAESLQNMEGYMSMAGLSSVTEGVRDQRKTMAYGVHATTHIEIRRKAILAKRSSICEGRNKNTKY